MPRSDGLLLPEHEQRVEAALDRLTLSGIVGQTLLGGWLHRAIDEDAVILIQQGKLGSVLVGKPAIGELAEAREQFTRLHHLAPQGLLIAADVEAGLGQIVAKGATRLPAALALGSHADAESRKRVARRAAEIVATEATAIGIRMFFGPVADLLTHPTNPIVNTRSYGLETRAVGAMLGEFIRAAQTCGLACVTKHFPGHGPTLGDSHLELPTVSLDAERLRTVELEPFRAAIDAGVAGMMVAHVHYPAFQPANERRPKVPASLSPSIVRGLLRDALRFPGVIVTDSLAMQAITKRQPLPEACIAALMAGNDLLILESDFAACHEAILHAVITGRLPEERIRAAAQRVLRLKEQLGLLPGEDRKPSIVTRGSLEVIGTPEHAEAARDMARGAIAMLRGRIAPVTKRLRRLPLSPLPVVGFFNGTQATAHGHPSVIANALRAMLSEHWPDDNIPWPSIAIHDDATSDDVDRLADYISAEMPLILVVFRRPTAYRVEGLGLSGRMAPLFDAALKRAAVLVVQGLPQDPPEWLPLSLDVPVLVTFSTDAASSLAAAEAMLGLTEAAVGRFPITWETGPWDSGMYASPS